MLLSGSELSVSSSMLDVAEESLSETVAETLSNVSLTEGVLTVSGAFGRLLSAQAVADAAIIHSAVSTAATDTGILCFNIKSEITVRIWEILELFF